MTAVVIMLSNYFHDLATGLLFGSIAAYFVAAAVVKKGASADDRDRLLEQLFSRFRPLVLGALLWVVLGGIPRMIFYYDYEWLPAAGRGQIAALVAKHILLFSVTAGSLLAFFKKRPRPAPLAPAVTTKTEARS